MRSTSFRIWRQRSRQVRFTTSTAGNLDLDNSAKMGRENPVAGAVPLPLHVQNPAISSIPCSTRISRACQFKRPPHPRSATRHYSDRTFRSSHSTQESCADHNFGLSAPHAFSHLATKCCQLQLSKKALIHSLSTDGITSCQQLSGICLRLNPNPFFCSYKSKYKCMQTNS